MIDFVFDNLSYVLAFLGAIVSAVFAVVNFFRTGSIKKLFSDLDIIAKESEEMSRYRLPSYREEDGTRATQTFDNKKKTYIYVKSSNSLEESPELVDLQEVMNSFLNDSLDAIIKKYSEQLSYVPPVADNTEDYVGQYNDVRNALDYMTEAIEQAEDLREQFGLSDDMSIDQIYKYAQMKSEELKAKITEKVSPSVASDGVIRPSPSVVNNEKESVSNEVSEKNA